MTELTIDQALQQGIEAHKAGRVQEADRLYTAILKAQPKHPGANHNMGVLAVSIGKIEQALPFFKTALEANPATAKFWLSYIDTLIKLDQLAEAQDVLDQAKSKGPNGDGFDQLEQSLQEARREPAEGRTKAPELQPKQPNILDTLKLDQAVKMATKKAKDGAAEEAGRIYQDILVKFPKNKRAIDGLKRLAGRPVGKAFKVQDPPQDQLKSLINLYNQGQLQSALELAKAITKQYPGAPMAWNVLAASYQGLGQSIEASKAFKKVTELSPQYCDGYNNLGVTLKAQGKLEEAIKAYNKALAIKPDYAEAHNNMGNALKDQGKSEEAMEAYNKALAIKPDYVEAYTNMGNAFKEQGKLEEAIEVYNKVLTIKPDHVEAYFNMGLSFKELGNVKEAIEAYNKALVIKPNYIEADYYMGIALKDQGDLEEAVKAFKRDNSIKSQTYLLKCLYALGNPADIYEQLEYLVERGVTNAVIGSYISRSQIKYGMKLKNPFCNDPLKYALHTNLSSDHNFKDIFIKGATDILTKDSVQNRVTSLLTKGTQTAGNFFNQIDDITVEIQSILRSEIENYRMHFSDSQEGLIKSWPTNYELNGWLVSMKSGGKIAPHMHDNGWISGSVYINVPPKKNIDSGNFVVCLENERENLSIDVVTGSLCLFPSSLLHYTIPFEADENRIVLAFDVIPKK